MQTILGIDLGTQSLKVIFYNPESKTIEATASAPIALDQNEQGKAEQDASWWTQALTAALTQIPSAVKDSAIAIGVSGQQHGFVPLGADGTVLAPVKLWCDTTTTEECDTITQGFGGAERCIAILGNPIVTGYTASKVLWLKKHRPDAYQALDTILLPHDYLNFYLSGERKMEYGDASGTALLDVRKRQWNREILEVIDADKDLFSCLPELISADEAAGTLREDIALTLGLPAGITISAGGGDNMMAAIGTGNVDKNVVTMSLGSSGTVYAHNDAPVVDKKGRLAAFCSSTNGWLPLLCTMNCTLSTELLRGLFKASIDELESAVSSSPVGSNGVLTLPFFNGERTPNLPRAKGSILGLDATNCSPENLLRSTMEGATFGLRMGIEALTDNGIEVKEIRLTGGGSKSSSWQEMVADICNTPVVMTKPDEGAAFGAVLQALYLYKIQHQQAASITALAAEHVIVDHDSTCHPIAENTAAYDLIFKQYKDAVTALANYYQ